MRLSVLSLVSLATVGAFDSCTDPSLPVLGGVDMVAFAGLKESTWSTAGTRVFSLPNAAVSQQPAAPPSPVSHVRQTCYPSFCCVPLPLDVGDSPTMGTSSISSTLNKYTFLFSTQSNKEAFDSDPWAWAPAWGGF